MSGSSEFPKKLNFIISVNVSVNSRLDAWQGLIPPSPHPRLMRKISLN